LVCTLTDPFVLFDGPLHGRLRVVFKDALEAGIGGQDGSNAVRGSLAAPEAEWQGNLTAVQVDVLAVDRPPTRSGYSRRICSNIERSITVSRSATGSEANAS
jgi:hypothetical protein